VKRLYRFDRVAEVLPSPEAVDDAAVARYAEDGYLAVADLLTPAEVAEARTALDDLIHGRVASYEGLQPEPEFKDVWPTLNASERADRVRKLFLFADYEPRLKALATRHVSLQTLLTRLLGEPCRLIQDMALLKPPHVGTEKPWHQDAAYFGWGPPEKVIGVWIALDPATAENGCMHVLPGTHREGPVAHTHARDCQIADERVQVERDVIVPLAPGGALFFSSLVHHGTPPNNSPHRRWAVQFHYAAESCVPIDRVQHAHLFLENGRYFGCRGQMGKLLEEVEP
jgi:phytanoyl-CoA hydroxylase